MTERNRLICLLTKIVPLPFKTITIIAEKLVEHGVTIQKWIPVTQRLPKEGEVVLVYDKFRCYYIGEYLYGLSFKAIGHHFITTAVAWMPLPEAPKEDL